MPGLAAAWKSAGKNFRVARQVVSRTLGGDAALSSVARWAAVGAGLGAIRGAADNIIGEDRVSILGGALQGAMLSGGGRALRLGARAFSGRPKPGYLFGGKFGGMGTASKMTPPLGSVSFRSKMGAAWRRMRPPFRGTRAGKQMNFNF